MKSSGDHPLPAPLEHDIQLAPGQRVGEYEIVEKIGQGGFGAVFKAVHPLIGKVVAVKVLSRTYASQPHMVSRFMAEARAANQIQHRNIIDIFAFGTLEDSLHYYIMEYLEGESLEQYLAYHGRLPIGEALALVAPIARALQAAHEKGIAHRDLKADNIFLARDNDGRVSPKLLDFGVAKLLNSSDQPVAHRTREGAPIGTPGYMSPEQALGQAVDHRTDIYAFGILLFRMLTGVMPFRDDSYMQVLFKHIHEAPPAPRSLAPDLPESVERSILAMLEKTPAARPADMLTALRDLELAARQAGIELPAEPAPTTLKIRAGTPSGRTTPPMQNSGGALGTEDTVAEGLGNAETLDSGATNHSTITGAPRSQSGPGPKMFAHGAAAEPTDAPGRPRSKLALMVGIAAALACAPALAYMLLPAGAITAPAANPSSARASALPNAPEAPARPAVPTEPPPTEPVPEGNAASATPAKPALVTITVTGTPKGTEVHGPSGFLGTAPGPLALEQRDEEVVLSFQAQGYETATATITPAADRTLEVAMKPKAKPGREPRPGAKPAGGKKDKRDALESPF